MAIAKHPNLQENKETEKITSPEVESSPISPPLEITAESFETKESIKTTEVGPTEEKFSGLPPAPAAAVQLSQIKPVKDKDLIAVENILSENLAEAFMQLSPKKQQEFKEEGEKVANTIWQMVESAKIQVRKVITLIKDWLKKLPGLNKFFLEQETKIKTDKIIALVRLHRGQTKQHGRER